MIIRNCYHSGPQKPTRISGIRKTTTSTSNHRCLLFVKHLRNFEQSSETNTSQRVPAITTKTCGSVVNTLVGIAGLLIGAELVSNVFLSSGLSNRETLKTLSRRCSQPWKRNWSAVISSMCMKIRSPAVVDLLIFRSTIQRQHPESPKGRDIVPFLLFLASISIRKYQINSIKSDVQKEKRFNFP